MISDAKSPFRASIHFNISLNPFLRRINSISKPKSLVLGYVVDRNLGNS